MGPDVSVCIATCRRPGGLARLLASLARQKLPPEIGVEVIVVDDAGDALRDAAGPDFPHPLRWIVAPAHNIAHARNRAVEAADGRWLAFVDDDEEADEHWLAAFLEAQEREPADGWFGPVLPRLERTVTPWLAPERFYARARHATGTPAGPSDLRTSNALLRRSLFRERGFDPAFGRSGGSDYALFSRLHREGARFLWCDEARVTEHVPPERHRLGWLSRRAFRGGVVHTRVARSAPGGAGGARGALRAAAALAVLVVALPPAFLFGRAAAARVWLRACVQAGHLWARAGRSFEEYA